MGDDTFINIDMPDFNEKEIPKLNSINAHDLQCLDIPPIEWIVDDVLPLGGIGVLSAPPKSYKSYMMLSLCLSVCRGEKFLDRFQCHRADCIYFDLESSRRRPRDRMLQIAGDNAVLPYNLHFVTAEEDVKPLGEGFEEQLMGMLTKFPKTKLVVIDVWQMIRKDAKRTQTAYSKDYQDNRILGEIAREYNVTLMLITHDRKMKDTSDVFNNISGSTGTLGSVDVAWKISRENRTDDKAIFSITGRDLKPQELSIWFDGEENHSGKGGFQWHCNGTEEEVEAERELKEFKYNGVIQLIYKMVTASDNGEWTTDASNILENGEALAGVTIREESGKAISNTLKRFRKMLLENMNIEYRVKQIKHINVYTFKENRK